MDGQPVPKNSANRAISCKICLHFEPTWALEMLTTVALACANDSLSCEAVEVGGREHVIQKCTPPSQVAKKQKRQVFYKLLGASQSHPVPQNDLKPSCKSSPLGSYHLTLLTLEPVMGTQHKVLAGMDEEALP